MPEGLTLGSLFDGLGGWCLSAARAGIKPIWSSEVEKFPMAFAAIEADKIIERVERVKKHGSGD